MSETFTKDQQDRYLELLGDGESSRAAAAAVGVGYWIPYYLRLSDLDFRRRAEAAEKRAAREADRAHRKVEKELERRQKRVDDALDGCVTYADAAKVLGVSREAVRQMVKRGTIPTVETPAGKLVVL